jgi:hypothetical protein
MQPTNQRVVERNHMVDNVANAKHLGSLLREAVGLGNEESIRPGHRRIAALAVSGRILRKDLLPVGSDVPLARSLDGPAVFALVLLGLGVRPFGVRFAPIRRARNAALTHFFSLVILRLERRALADQARRCLPVANLRTLPEFVSSRSAATAGSDCAQLFWQCLLQMQTLMGSLHLPATNSAHVTFACGEPRLRPNCDLPGGPAGCDPAFTRPLDQGRASPNIAWNMSAGLAMGLFAPPARRVPAELPRAGAPMLFIRVY